MKILEAVAALAAAHEAGQVELPHCPMPNGLDLGVEFVVALAIATDRLRECKTVEDLVNASIHAGEKVMAGTFDQPTMEHAMIRVIKKVERAGKRVEHDSQRFVAEMN